MGLNEYLKCPGLEQTLAVKPQLFPCLSCGEDIEAWTDEASCRCDSCHFSFTIIKTGQDSFKLEFKIKNNKVKSLLDFALESGADAVKAIPANQVKVREDLAKMCKEPRCPNYGQSASCPPAVEGPQAFIEGLKKFSYAVVFRLDAPADIVLSSQRPEIGRLIHEIAAGIEKKAKENGFNEALAYAAGSCKKMFCAEHAHCRVVDKGGDCRNPQLARHSMSGYGVDVNHLTKMAGWPALRSGGKAKPGETIIPLYGLILVG